MSKSVEYFFAFGGTPYEISSTQVAYCGQTICELTGKYDRVFLDNVETQFVEIVVKEHEENRYTEPTLFEWLKGKRAEWVKEIVPECRKYINIDDLRCRAVIHETFSCTTS